MISEQDVRDALQKITRSSRVREWPLDHDFLKGSLDSLDHVALALRLEEAHGLKISDADLPKLRTIQAILDYAGAKG